MEEVNEGSVPASQTQGVGEQPVIVEDLESSSDTDEKKRKTAEDDNKEKNEGCSRTKNSAFMFAIKIDEPSGKGKNAICKCLLCNKVITRKNFPAHIDNVHTSKSKCELCGKSLSS